MRAPHLVIDGLLGPAEADGVLAALLACEEGMAASRVSRSDGGAVEPGIRKSASFALPGRAATPLRAVILKDRADWFAALGIPPFEPSDPELDGVVHRDGDFFARHVDLSTDRMRGTSDRVLTAIYYVHRRPRGFDGGELVLHPIGGDRVVVEPRHDRLVVFPSYLEHEVTTVSVPGDAFADARFSINCWLRRPRG